jgi:hypothetical protein
VLWTTGRVAFERRAPLSVSARPPVGDGARMPEVGRSATLALACPKATAAKNW